MPSVPGLVTTLNSAALNTKATEVEKKTSGIINLPTRVALSAKG